MTAFETWTSALVEILVGDALNLPLDPTSAEMEEAKRELSQRIAAGLVQARALECRHLAGELIVNNPSHPIIASVARECWERSHKLEAIAMQFAKEWPPAEGHEVMVCRCAINTGEVQVDAGHGTEDGRGVVFDGSDMLFVCAQCKLPKRGNAAPGPVLVTQ